MKRTKFLTISIAAMLYSSSALAQYNEDISFDNRLVDAVNSNNINIVEAILSTGENPNQAGKFETSPLHRAAVNGNLDIAKLLIENGADVNIRDYGGASPLHVAARVGEIEFAKILIQNNADLNSYDAQGFTPLHRAVVNKQTPISIFFIKAGAEVNTVNNDGNSPIIDAVRNSQPSILKELLIAGADKSVRNSNGQDAIDFAIKAGNPEIDFLLSATPSELVASDNSIPSFLKKEAKITAHNNSFKQVFDDVVKVPTENIIAEDIQTLAPAYAAEEKPSIVRNDYVANNLPASMQIKSAKKTEDIAPKKVEPLKLEPVKAETIKAKPKSLDKVEIKPEFKEFPLEPILEEKLVKIPASKPAAKNLPKKTKPILAETKPAQQPAAPIKVEPKIEKKLEPKAEVKPEPVAEKKTEAKKKEVKEVKKTKIENKDIKPIALPKLQFIDIPMQIEEDATNKKSVSFDSSSALDKDKAEDVIKLPKLEAAIQESPKPKAKKIAEEKKQKPIKETKNKIEDKKDLALVPAKEPAELDKVSPEPELPASMKNKNPEIIPEEPKQKLSPAIIARQPEASENFKLKTSTLTFPVTSLQVISLENNTSVSAYNNNVLPKEEKIEEAKTGNIIANKTPDIDKKYLNEVDQLLSSSNNSFSTQLVDINFEMVQPEVSLPKSLLIKDLLENKASQLATKNSVALDKPLKEEIETVSVEQETAVTPTEISNAEITSANPTHNTNVNVTSDYNNYRTSLINSIKEFYNSSDKLKNTYDLSNLESERSQTLGLKVNEKENFAVLSSDSFLQSDVVAAPAASVETEELASLSVENSLENISVTEKKGLGFGFADNGFYSIIGDFENESEALNYINKATEDFSEKVKFTVEKDSISNKFLLKIGAVADEETAAKLCELFSSKNLTCNIN
jgi:ankyrin repeat protein